MKYLLAVFFSLIVIALNAESTWSKTCNFFIIKESSRDVIIEKVLLLENEPMKFTDKDILSYVMVFAPGSKSGELIFKKDRLNTITALYTNNEIKINILNNDGTTREMPTIDLDQAIKCVVRINISGANGYKKAYRIEDWNVVLSDYGPVVDMFAGQIPLNPGDYSFLTESLEAKSESILSGESPYAIIQNWITVDCLLPGGNVGRFVVDFGATSSVVDRSILPEDSDIKKFQIVEYSAQGERISNAEVGGATGMVDNILGKAFLSNFSFGDIELPGFKITVLKSFPEVFVRYGISGIIGMDILDKTNFIIFENLNQIHGAHVMRFSETLATDLVSNHTIPFEMASGHIFLNGRIKDKEVSFLLDTGAGKSVIGKKLVEKHDIQYHSKSNEKKVGTGLDGTGTEFEDIIINDIMIEDIELSDFEFMLFETFIFEGMGLQEEAALLGMNFLLKYSGVCFDLKNNELLLRK